MIPEVNEPEPFVPPEAEDVCEGDRSPGRAPLRRLTVDEYDQSVLQLLGDDSHPAQRLIDDERDASADTRIVSALLAEQYMAAAEEISARATEGDELANTLGCELNDDCVHDFIDRFTSRAFRRPITEDERNELRDLYAMGKSELSEREGVMLLIETVLQSPDFLYRVERGVGSGEVLRLSDWEIATRLSFFIFGSPPDEALQDATAGGALSTDEGVAEMAATMLENPNAERMMQGFFAKLLELDHTEGLEKDPELFPEFSPEVAALFRAETQAFVHEVMIEGDGSWETLMTAPWSMMNRDLAEYYGVSGPSGDTFERVDLDPNYHSGMLTQGSVLAPRARFHETSPIHRGMFVRGSLQCGSVPDVPEGLDTTPPDPDPNLTTRERLAAHRSDPNCQDCHARFDPLGFAFEHFDAAGVYRETEQGLPIDATGEFAHFDTEGEFDGAPDLAQQLVGSPQAQTCFVEHWFNYLHARPLSEHDRCSLARSYERFRDSNFNVRELIVSLVQTDAFLYRTADQDRVPPEPTGSSSEESE